MRTIDRFLREVASGLGPWAIYAARFDRRVASRGDEDRGFSMALDLMRGDSLAHIGTPTTGGPLAKQLSALRRLGYRIYGRRWHGALRQLCGSREILAEADRASALCDPTTVLSLRSRAVRPRLNQSRKSPFPAAAFAELLKRRDEWRFGWLAIERRGPCTFSGFPDWRAVSWCSVVLDDEAERQEVGAQLFRKPDGPPATFAEVERLRRAMREVLGPHGYRYLKLRYTSERQGPPDMINFDKEVHSLAEARRERARIDQLVFGGDK